MDSDDLCSSLKLLLTNSRDEFLNASKILLQYANNVISNPQNEKYRTIRMQNKIVQERLVPVKGAVLCLHGMGFTFSDDAQYLILPQSSSLDELKKVERELQTERQKLLSSQHSTPAANSNQSESQSVSQTASNLKSGFSGPVQSSTTANPPSLAASTAQSKSAADIQRLELGFLQKLKSSIRLVQMYEDIQLQDKARSIIPVSTLREKAARKLQALTAMENTHDNGIGIRELLLLELLAWFKHDFFSWIDTPKCTSCAGVTVSVGMVEAYPSELQWGASRVENSRCDRCATSVRFPRYNHPGKLLDTRAGRCGEWANCFTLCCRALGFEARYVLDWTDHVWTEVYSTSQKRWLHCDPCENVCDKPLLYEAGWGKKLTYVIAFSRDDIQDVTWRYSQKHDDVRQRRQECREDWLVKTITTLRNELQEHLDPNRKGELGDRMVCELTEFMSVSRTASGEELLGRSTGSLAWRQARGETGSQSANVKKTVIKMTPSECKQKKLVLKYNCATDNYIREVDSDVEINGWQTFVYQASNIHRKEENDWKMVYLARDEGTDMAMITWNFDFDGSGLAVDVIYLVVESKSYENGEITWKLSGQNKTETLPPGCMKRRFDTLSGSTTLTLTAVLKGGKGNVAWQHTQLFRQEMQDRSGFPFEVVILLKTL